ncbi:MAG TPA: plastocyanin/azurin family copper-binding protein [Acidimicrobiia bacterium]|nr:plastocyanin/azurin family copper-binding protein [Acidimicrobiia bacterium]
MGRRALALFAIVTLTACGGGGSKSTPTTLPAPVDERGHKVVEVIAKDNAFSPASIIVDLGTKVTWRNDDNVAHNIDNFGGGFGVLLSQFGPGASYSFKFTTAGTFTYTCTIHTGMAGQVEAR